MAGIMAWRLIIATAPAVAVVLGLAGCSHGQSQDYIDGYQKGYSVAGSATSLSGNWAQSQAQDFCGSNAYSESITGGDEDYGAGYLAGCVDGATGRRDRFGS